METLCPEFSGADPVTAGPCPKKNSNMRLVFITATALCTTISGAIAEDKIIVTGLRPVAPENVASTVTVLTEEDLAIRDTPYLADQLRQVPGLGVSRSGAAGGLTQVRIRGAEANHTLVLLNGIEISDPTTGETDFGLLTGLDAERIEVLRGEQSGLYGSDAIGGVINIVTRTDGGFAGLLEGGSDSTVRFQSRYGVGTDKTGFVLNLSGFSTEGIDTSATTGEEDGSSGYAALIMGHRNLDENWRLSGLLRYSQDDVESDADVDFDGLLEDSNRETDSEQLVLGASLSGSAGPMDHLFRASFSDLTRENSAGNTFTDETKGQRTKFSYSPSRSFALEKGMVTASGLLDYEKEDYERISTDTFFGDPNQRQSFETTGVAAEIRADLQTLTLTGSVRHDSNDNRFDDATTWRIGAAYALTPETRLRASFGTGFKNPTFTELFGFFPSQFIGNPDLQPEESTGYEVGIDYTAADFSLSATWFNADLEDEIVTVFNPDFTSSPANLEGESSREGIELAARWQINNTTSLSASFTDLSSDNDSNTDEIRVPEQTGSLALSWQSPDRDGLRAGLALDYVGAQDDFFFTFPARRVTLDSYTLFSATAEYPLAENVSLTIRGQNILDEEITDVFGFEQPGAQFFVGLRVQ